MMVTNLPISNINYIILRVLLPKSGSTDVGGYEDGDNEEDDLVEIKAEDDLSESGNEDGEDEEEGIEKEFKLGALKDDSGGEEYVKEEGDGEEEEGQGEDESESESESEDGVEDSEQSESEIEMKQVHNPPNKQVYSLSFALYCPLLFSLDTAL